MAVSNIFAALLLGSMLLATGCGRSSGSTVAAEAFDPLQPRIALAASPPALFCPAAGASSLKPSAVTGHHRVVFSWSASAPAARPEDNAVGYCLYRSQMKGAARDNATCRGCEQINLVPVTGTSCVDDLVQDSALYYYVVTAITADNRRSISSNEIAVTIPPGNQLAKAKSPSSAPLCRASAGPN